MLHSCSYYQWQCCYYVELLQLLSVVAVLLHGITAVAPATAGVAASPAVTLPCGDNTFRTNLYYSNRLTSMIVVTSLQFGMILLSVPLAACISFSAGTFVVSSGLSLMCHLVPSSCPPPGNTQRSHWSTEKDTPANSPSHWLTR